MKLLYIECVMGAAGDMLMAALFELLDDNGRRLFLSDMSGLGDTPGMGTIQLDPQVADTCGITGTRMQVTVAGSTEESVDLGHKHNHPTQPHTHHHTTLCDVLSLIKGLPLPDVVLEHAANIYQQIAQAEAKVHNSPVSQIHFHEVGMLDAIVDVVGVCYARHLLAPDQIIVSPIHVGSGQVHCAHGLIPVPAPATAQLLKGTPFYSTGIKGELCTPTGAALLTYLADSFGPMPPFIVDDIGYGIGHKQLEAANCVRAFVGHTASINTVYTH